MVCCRAWTRTKNTHIQSVVCYQLHHAANIETITAADLWIKDWSFMFMVAFTRVLIGGVRRCLWRGRACSWRGRSRESYFVQSRQAA